jgi:hypothetical protein
MTGAAEFFKCLRPSTGRAYPNVEEGCSNPHKYNLSTAITSTSAIQTASQSPDLIWVFRFIASSFATKGTVRLINSLLDGFDDTGCRS